MLNDLAPDENKNLWINLCIAHLLCGMNYTTVDGKNFVISVRNSDLIKDLKLCNGNRKKFLNHFENIKDSEFSLIPFEWKEFGKLGSLEDFLFIVRLILIFA